MAVVNQHRKGDSWSYTGTFTVKNADGSESNLAGWKIVSRLFTSRNVEIAVFECGWISEKSGTFFHRCIDTSNWTKGKAYFNIKFTSPSGESTSTDPVDISILEALS